MDLATVLSSGVVAGLVAGLVTLRVNERKIAIENITQQRQIWREKIRLKAVEVVKEYASNNKPKIIELYVDFQLILNPEDKLDTSILDTIWKMSQTENDLSLSIELSEKLALLLKHDWERAKNESKPILFGSSEPERITYENFSNKRNVHNS